MNRSFQSPPQLAGQTPAAESSNHAICFRTDSDGRIALSENWLEIANKAEAHMDSIYIQTKHSHARLVARAKTQPYNWIEADRLAASDDNRLLLRPNNHSSAIARVQRCDCCGCPGRIEFRNRNGEEFLQLCAPQDLSPHDWGSYIQSIAKTNNQLSPAEYGPFSTVPTSPENSVTLPLHPDVIGEIIPLLKSENVQIEVTLVNRETIHRRNIVLDTIEYGDDLLGVYSPRASFQLNLKAVRSLKQSFRIDGHRRLFVVGTDNVQLLSIEASSDQHSQLAFDEIVSELSS